MEQDHSTQQEMAIPIMYKIIKADYKNFQKMA